MDFTCPYCNHDTTITTPNLSESGVKILTENSEIRFISLRHQAIACPNPKCKKLSLSVSTHSHNCINYYRQNSSVLQEWSLLPSTSAKPQPDYIPRAVIADYYEACSILKLSPKASATLSRRCLQGIVRDFWNIPKGDRGNLGAELSFIKDKVDPDTWDGIEAIRSVGDVGAHMEKDVNYVVDVDEDEASLLVQLIETLIEDWYIVRHKRKVRSERAKALSKSKLEEKKAAKAASKKSDEEKEVST